MDYSLPGSSVHGIFQARILEMSCPPPGNFPDPGIKPIFLMSSALAGGFFTISTICKIELMNKLKNIVISSSVIFIVATTIY